MGVDRAPEAIEFARAHYPGDNLTFEEASCEALPQPDASFELVVAFEVIEHLEDWRGFLREARRVLAPNGQLEMCIRDRTNRERELYSMFRTKNLALVLMGVALASAPALVARRPGPGCRPAGQAKDS